MTTTSPSATESVVVPAHRDPTEYLRALAERDREVALAQAATSTTGSDPAEDISPPPRQGRSLTLILAVFVLSVAVAVAGVTALRGSAEPVAAVADVTAPILVPASIAPVETGRPVLSMTPAPATHTVEAGDTLEQIALRYDTTVPALIELNDLADPNALFVGQVILVPVEGAPADATAN